MKFIISPQPQLLKYMKAIRATLTTSQPVISEQEFQTMFFKIDELFSVHTRFLNNLRQKVAQDSGGGSEICVGETFRELADHMHLYGAFLHNYGRAIDTVKKCGSNNQQFKEIVSKIVLNSTNEQSLTLEDLLHKPVARVQKNAMVLEDLLNETPAAHIDYQSLKQSQKMVRNFLSEFNVIPTKNMFPVSVKKNPYKFKQLTTIRLSPSPRTNRCDAWLKIHLSSNWPMVIANCDIFSSLTTSSLVPNTKQVAAVVSSSN